MEKEKQLLVLCRNLVEQSLNWGDSITWGNDDFDQLSEKIFEKTKVQLSVSTLKRIWGKVRYENFPTAATLNALARYLDYASWREFRQKNEPVEPEQIKETIQSAAPQAAAPVAAATHLQIDAPAKTKPRKAKSRLSIPAGCRFIDFGGFYFYFFTKPS